MELQLRLKGPKSEKEIREVEKWVRDEEIDDLNVELRNLPPKPGTLGDAVTILTAIAELAPPLLALAGSLVNHFRARPPDPSCRLEISSGRNTITIEGAHLTDEDRIRKTIENALSGELKES
ncbi:hypothetical protein MYX78_00180 [Acidobacteria bacterium AH-259-G07]|nr:hypothetical protein [Acidobacteria bacterium AH-259-G07]